MDQLTVSQLLSELENTPLASRWKWEYLAAARQAYESEREETVKLLHRWEAACDKERRRADGIRDEQRRLFQEYLEEELPKLIKEFVGEANQERDYHREIADKCLGFLNDYDSVPFAPKPPEGENLSVIKPVRFCPTMVQQVSDETGHGDFGEFVRWSVEVGLRMRRNTRPADRNT